ncbi:hypothetical protein HM131_18005 [Halobacillus mangrovi]|uniref:Uncharacterized protein n=1 Tax=Halobacillus mangrovi TaxID=402384 RepID=A0A1W5ZZ68_9BACI|nr:hypothetical protein HM131_18005 [Halobacillus mangrovi]
MTRLQWEKDLDETPQRAQRNEEARQFPHRKASYFPAIPYPITNTNPNYLKFESSRIIMLFNGRNVKKRSIKGCEEVKTSGGLL